MGRLLLIVSLAISANSFAAGACGNDVNRQKASKDMQACMKTATTDAEMASCGDRAVAACNDGDPNAPSIAPRVQISAEDAYAAMNQTGMDPNAWADACRTGGGGIKPGSQYSECQQAARYYLSNVNE